jgi:hypothetical protein
MGLTSKEEGPVVGFCNESEGTLFLGKVLE